MSFHCLLSFLLLIPEYALIFKIGRVNFSCCSLPYKRILLTKFPKSFPTNRPLLEKQHCPDYHPVLDASFNRAGPGGPLSMWAREA